MSRCIQDNIENIWIVLITIIITGVITGGIAYYAGRNQWDKEKIDLENKVQSLESEISSLNQQVLELQSDSESEQTPLDQTE